MKKFTIYSLQALSLVALFLLSPRAFSLSPVYAHLAGQPPFFVVNGVYSNLYPVPLTSLENFDLPQDLAPGKFVVDKSISFKLDTKVLPAPPDVIAKTQFFWDFGDGTKGQGLSNTHTYTKIGSHILTINAFDGTTPAPQILESALINVLPNENYQLPKAVIKVNGRESTDPLTDILVFPSNNTFKFDATLSTDPEAKITSYTWDFGDTNSSDQPIISHVYTRDFNQVFPVLRIKDSNGFLADAFVEVEKGANISGGFEAPSSKPLANSEGSNNNFLPKVFLGILALVVLGLVLKKRKRVKV